LLPSPSVRAYEYDHTPLPAVPAIDERADAPPPLPLDAARTQTTLATTPAPPTSSSMTTATLQRLDPRLALLPRPELPSDEIDARDAPPPLPVRRVRGVV
jgi:hypothetical protein